MKKIILLLIIFVAVVYLFFPSFFQNRNTLETWMITPGLILLILVFFIYKFFDTIRYETRYTPVRRFFGFLFAILLFPIAFPVFIIMWIKDADGIRSRPSSFEDDGLSDPWIDP